MTNSAYAEMHKADWVPGHYDQVIYDPAGYDTFVWDLQRQFLARIVGRLAAHRSQFAYLDFACGTGRIIAALEDFATDATGLDISPQMADAARARVNHARILAGDILDNGTLGDTQFDLITAFRFFLNTEPAMREQVMEALARHLRNRDARLIFNVHGHALSANGIKSCYQWLRGWGFASSMTLPQVRALVEQHGLIIERFYGFGLFPRRLYRGRMAPLVKRIDTWACRRPMFRWVSNDLLFICRAARNA